MAFAAAPAAAEPWDCRFTVACRAAGDCADSGLALRVIAADHAGDLFLSSAMGDSPVARLTQPAILPASYAGMGHDGTAQVLTITQDRLALMTRHIPGDAAGPTASITYFGTCEAMI